LPVCNVPLPLQKHHRHGTCRTKKVGTFHVLSNSPPHSIPSLRLSCFHPASLSICCHFAPTIQVMTTDTSLHTSHHALCRHQPPASPKAPWKPLDSGTTAIRPNPTCQYRRRAAGCSSPVRQPCRRPRAVPAAVPQPPPCALGWVGPREFFKKPTADSRRLCSCRRETASPTTTPSSSGVCLSQIRPANGRGRPVWVKVSAKARYVLFLASKCCA
jgi:hypothetical protein